jgi:hypothetical protein
MAGLLADAIRVIKLVSAIRQSVLRHIAEIKPFRV